MGEGQLFCPWCRRLGFPSLPDLKKHVKYCSFAPRPRGQQHTKRMEKLCARTTEDLFGLTPADEKEKGK
jgi:hypothetical protein